MFSLLSFISVTAGAVGWNTRRTKVNLKLKNNCFTIISISNLNAKTVCLSGVLCSNKLFCVVVVLFISPTVPVKYLSC